MRFAIKKEDVLTHPLFRNSVEAPCNSVEAPCDSVEAPCNSVEAPCNSAEAPQKSAEAPQKIRLFALYFTIHSKRPAESLSGSVTSSLTALVLTGVKWTAQAVPGAAG